MWIELTRNTMVEGVARAVGEIVEVEEMLGEALIYMKKARLRQAQPTDLRQAQPTEVAVVEPKEVAITEAEEKAILEPLEVARPGRDQKGPRRKDR